MGVAAALATEMVEATDAVDCAETEATEAMEVAAAVATEAVEMADTEAMEAEETTAKGFPPMGLSVASRLAEFR